LRSPALQESKNFMPVWEMGDVYSCYMPEIALQCKDFSEKRWQIGLRKIFDPPQANKFSDNME